MAPCRSPRNTSPGLLDPAAGCAGMLALPWLLVSPLVLPTAGPLADLSLITLLAGHHISAVTLAVLLAIALDLLATVAVLLDGESWLIVCLSPFIRLPWRPPPTRHHRPLRPGLGLWTHRNLAAVHPLRQDPGRFL